MWCVDDHVGGIAAPNLRRAAHHAVLAACSYEGPLPPHLTLVQAAGGKRGAAGAGAPQRQAQVDGMPGLAHCGLAHQTIALLYHANLLNVVASLPRDVALSIGAVGSAHLHTAHACVCHTSSEVQARTLLNCADWWEPGNCIVAVPRWQ